LKKNKIVYRVADRIPDSVVEKPDNIIFLVRKRIHSEDIHGLSSKLLLTFPLPS